MLNGSNRTGPVDKCGEGYRSVNICITFLVAVIHLNALARLSHCSGSDFKQRGFVGGRYIFLSRSCLFEVLEECVVCSLEFTHLQDSL